MQEFFLREAITAHLNRDNLLDHAQHGFVMGRSTLTNLLLTMDKITESINQSIYY